MKHKVSILAVLLLAPPTALQATEFHVATTGNDMNPGSKSKPFKTIQAAANVAQPGDTITVHAGIYREWVNPPRGGESDAKRIVYQAAPGEKVVITGGGNREELDEGARRCLESDDSEFVLRLVQSTQRTHPWRLVRQSRRLPSPHGS
jgi:hypothetical protein